MSRDFTKVAPAIWNSPGFAKLSDRAKLLHFYLLTCRHQNLSGCFHLRDGYACADLGWTPRTYVKLRQELVDSDLVLFDDDTNTIYVRRWFQHGGPTNKNHALGIERVIDKIECDEIRERVREEFELSATRFTSTDEATDYSHLTETNLMRGRRRV